MSNHTDVSIDLEFLSHADNAVILSVGLCPFTRASDSQETALELLPVTIVLDIQEQLDMGRKIDADTLKWWVQQSEKAKAEVFDADRVWGIRDALTEIEKYLALWSGDGSPCLWGNGITADISKLRNLYHQLGQREPWDFWYERDVRTLVEIGRANGLTHKEDMKFEGTQHSAGDDALHQAKYIAAYLEDLRLTKDL